MDTNGCIFSVLGTVASLVVVFEPSHTSWLDYVTAFGTLGSAIAAGAAAIVSLHIAANDRARADKALNDQLFAATTSQMNEWAKAELRSGIARRLDLLMSLAEERGTIKCDFHGTGAAVGRARGRGLVAALGGEDRPPNAATALSGDPSTLAAAIDEVANAIAELPIRRYWIANFAASARR